jgi:hypothetical protein
MERIDRTFATVPWLEDFPNHHLKSLSSDCSDHAPLLLYLNTEPWAVPRFRFKGFWVQLDGFDEVVREAWECDLDGVDACRTLDFKLRRTAKALKSWSMHNVGSVCLQLFMVREIIGHLDVDQKSRELMPEELSLRDELKGHSLGLASLARTIARIRYLEEGDANTKFFHLQACHRSRKNVFERLHSLHLDDLLPRLDLTGIDACFTEEEIWATVKELPPDRAPGPDGFTSRFYKVAWGVIKQDIINVFNALCNNFDFLCFFLCFMISSCKTLLSFK